PESLLGTAATGGGVRHRGNTSYVRGARRSLSLEFDRPVAWTGAPAPASHVLLLSGYADATRLRNALCFDAFSAMHPDAPRGAVPVSWTDVFVNGEWAGVWETAPRLKDMVSDWATPVYKVRTPEGLWSRVSADMLDRRDGAGPGEPDAADAYDPFLELARFVVESDDVGFAARAGEFFDLDDLADMVLLLDFTGNVDGRTTNQYVVRRRSDGRWLVLPWDYDKTFLGGKYRELPLSNPLYDRCRRCVPGFGERLAARWAALRAGSLSDAALERWIDGKAALLAPYMDEDFRLVPPAGADGGCDYARAVEELREEVLFRARRLDGRLGPGPR
ncbi:MAG: CotH kinase family protein, partial [Kiritimatiellae bacterium]|nr:CotH kinase family protein [Kiritimatiellia bacterium]